LPKLLCLRQGTPHRRLVLALVNQAQTPAAAESANAVKDHAASTAAGTQEPWPLATEVLARWRNCHPLADDLRCPVGPADWVFEDQAVPIRPDRDASGPCSIRWPRKHSGSAILQHAMTLKISHIQPTQAFAGWSSAAGSPIAW